MAGISLTVALMVLAAITAQVFALFLLPLTRGMTELLPSLGTIVGFLVSMVLMARIIHAGVNLSLLMPILAATVPLAGIALGMLYFGEAASLAKVAALIVACVLVGVANLL
jgi:multidrug transporter EmrE-like cation transporter